MILSLLGCAVAVLTAQQPGPPTASAVDGAHFLSSIRSYAEGHGSGTVLADDNLNVTTQVTAIDNDHFAYKLIMAAKLANVSKIEYAESRFDFPWKNAYAIQVDPSDQLGWRVTVFMLKPAKSWALLTPRISKMTTTMVLNERAQPFAHAIESDMDQCYFWFSTRGETNTFRDLLVGAVHRLADIQLLRVQGNVVRDAEYGLPDDNRVTWQKNQSTALLDGVIPYEPKTTGVQLPDGAEILATGPGSSFAPGDVITGIRAPDVHTYTPVHNWADIRTFLAKANATKVVIRTSTNADEDSPGKQVDVTYSSGT